ncbi:MAG: hypothetical protein KGH61_01985 [Candidatus Micrarchaeota archaeon]|nr:hypothetical protein [Candidatus Micrarchaeota archaeon]MDE1847700.1 hypothetical protein [Candidatus Micrarchaeota archaeon]MDE1864129.1 hypothetical protein [Candidatus Micrarchaeota archaeon]
MTEGGTKWKYLGEVKEMFKANINGSDSAGRPLPLAFGMYAIAAGIIDLSILLRNELRDRHS